MPKRAVKSEVLGADVDFLIDSCTEWLCFVYEDIILWYASLNEAQWRNRDFRLVGGGRNKPEIAC